MPDGLGTSARAMLSVLQCCIYKFVRCKVWKWATVLRCSRIKRAKFLSDTTPMMTSKSVRLKYDCLCLRVDRGHKGHSHIQRVWPTIDFCIAVCVEDKGLWRNLLRSAYHKPSAKTVLDPSKERRRHQQRRARTSAQSQTSLLSLQRIGRVPLTDISRPVLRSGSKRVVNFPW